MSTLKFLKLTLTVYVLQVALVHSVYSQCPRTFDHIANVSTVDHDKITPESEFSQDPERFLSFNAITNDCIGKPGTTIPSNGESGSFGLWPLSDGSGYQFYFKSPGQTGIHATYLQTKEHLTISAGQRNTLVVTPMLQGCSIYVRKNPEGTLTIYHHYRSQTDQLECTPEGCYVVIGGQPEWFDDVYEFEEYNGGNFDDPNAATCDKYRPEGGFTMASLPFLLERAGAWWFLDQTVCYDQRNPAGYFVDLKLIDFRIRQIRLAS